jgi:CubicO group peptidase (beta-lactamase class C family)/D-alanyl-D-alanine dipeptidase
VIIFGASFFWGTGVRAQEVNQQLPHALKKLESWVADQVAAKSLPNLSIALIDDQRVVWAEGFGFEDANGRRRATADTAYRVGSVSKLFTDLAVMQLVEQKRLDLGDPVSALLPEFAPKNSFKTEITLRHLITHQSGLVREPPIGHYFDPEPRSLLDVVRSLSATSLIFEPGTRTKYSNAGVTVVGAVFERAVGQPFPVAIDRTLLSPLGMKASSFAPGAELQKRIASGKMWTHDGQTIETPTFLLGTGPAGNLVSTVVDLGKFVSMIFAEGRSANGPIVSRETLRSMIEPASDKQADAGFGLGFALSQLDGEPMIGHGGAVYGFATEVQALPRSRLGVAVITGVDCGNGIASRIATTALKVMLAARKGTALPPLETSRPLAREQARRLAGRYVSEDKSVELVDRDGKLFLDEAGGMTLEIRAQGDALVIDDRLVSGPRIKADGNSVTLGTRQYSRAPSNKPAPCSEKFSGLIGEYGWDHDVLYILERDGELHARIEWFFDYPLKEVGPDRFVFPDHGLYAGETLDFARDAEKFGSRANVAGVSFPRRRLDGEGGKTFRIKPRRPVDEVRAEVQAAEPPRETGTFRSPDLVELTELDPSIKLDIRYATDNNFLGAVMYTQARAFLERPAAEALVRVHRALAKRGYGLLIHDAYRPWRVTKLFWDATPDSGRGFVANPARGSKHNRGAAVDLTLFDLASGKPVKMVGGYDEFSPRSYPDYPGGTGLERWHRELLRSSMEAEGFTVNEVEWWHFDHQDWRQYPIINLRFEELKVIKKDR